MKLLLDKVDFTRLLEINASGADAVLAAYRAAGAKASLASALLLKAESERICQTLSGKRRGNNCKVYVDEALAIRKDLFGEDSLEYFEAVFADVGIMCHTSDEDSLVNRDAESTMRRAISTLEAKSQMSTTVDENVDVPLTQALVLIAEVVGAKWRRSDAVALYAVAIEKIAKVFGRDSLQVIF